MIFTNKDFVLREEELDSFEEDGFVVLRDFLSEEFMELSEKLSDGNIEKPSTNYGSTFNRLKYDVGNNDKIILGLVQDETFQKVMLSLTKKELLFTQGLSFELEKNKDKGFPWHVGTVSFGCQRKEDMGYTMWIPFCEINPDRQRGGDETSFSK